MRTSKSCTVSWDSGIPSSAGRLAHLAGERVGREAGRQRAGRDREGDVPDLAACLDEAGRGAAAAELAVVGVRGEDERSLPGFDHQRMHITVAGRVRVRRVAAWRGRHRASVRVGARMTHVAAVLGALGAPLLLVAGRRALVLAGLGLIALAEAVLAVSGPSGFSAGARRPRPRRARDRSAS